MPLEKGSSREVVSREAESKKKDTAENHPAFQNVTGASLFNKTKALKILAPKTEKTKDGILNWAGGNRTMSPTVAGGKTLDPKANANRTTTAVDTTLNAGHHRQAVTPAVRRSAMDVNIARINDAKSLPNGEGSAEKKPSEAVIKKEASIREKQAESTYQKVKSQLQKSGSLSKDADETKNAAQLAKSKAALGYGDKKYSDLSPKALQQVKAHAESAARGNDEWSDEAREKAKEALKHGGSGLPAKSQTGGKGDHPDQKKEFKQERKQRQAENRAERRSENKRY